MPNHHSWALKVSCLGVGTEYSLFLVSGSQTMDILYAQLKLMVDNQVVRDWTGPNDRFLTAAQEWSEH